MMRGSLVLVVMVAGCGAAVVPESGADTTSSTSTTTTTSTTSTAATTAMLDTTSPPDPSTTLDEDGSTSTDGYEPPKLDVAGPDVGAVIETCASTGAQIGDLTVVTPSGPFAATHAWWAWEACCINDPWLLLAAASEVEVIDNAIVTPHVMIHVPGTWESSEPFVGPFDARLRDVDTHAFSDPIAGLELTEPLDPELPPDPMQSFVGTFAIDGGGWTITGSVDAPYCPAIENPACPCE